MTNTQNFIVSQDGVEFAVVAAPDANQAVRIAVRNRLGSLAFDAVPYGYGAIALGGSVLPGGVQ